MTTRWPQSANRSFDIVSGAPQCCACEEPAVRFVGVQWGFGHHSDHPVCERHLQMYRADFDGLAPTLKRIARESREDVA